MNIVLKSTECYLFVFIVNACVIILSITEMARNTLFRCLKVYKGLYRCGVDILSDKGNRERVAPPASLLYMIFQLFHAFICNCSSDNGSKRVFQRK